MIIKSPFVECADVFNLLVLQAGHHVVGLPEEQRFGDVYYAVKHLDRLFHLVSGTVHHNMKQVEWLGRLSLSHPGWELRKVSTREHRRLISLRRLSLSGMRDISLASYGLATSI